MEFVQQVALVEKMIEHVHRIGREVVRVRTSVDQELFLLL
jgi:hypothetical protein